MMTPIHRTLLIVVLAWHGASYAAGGKVFRCTDAEGHVVFSDTGCGSASQKVDVVESSGGLSPISGNGLSAQESADLSAINAQEAQAAAQRAQGGATSAPSSPAPAVSPSPPPMSHGY